MNAVRNYRESVGLRSRPSTIVKHLQECGVLDTTVSPVRYALGAATGASQDKTAG